MDFAHCTVCEHPNRVDIDTALLSGQPINKVGVFYGVASKHIIAHKELCSPYLATQDDFNQMVQNEVYEILETENINTSQSATPKKPASFGAQLGLRETDILVSSINQMLIMQTSLGREINKFLTNMDTPEGLLAQQKFLRKPVMDAYVLVGSEIRQSVKTLADIQAMLVKPEAAKDPFEAMKALSLAIAGANRQNNNTTEMSAHERLE